MTSAWSQLEQMLTCAICLDKFKNPRLLPCQHSFCGDACMEGLVDYARRQIKCPECRAEHRIPYQGVTSLPSNVTLIRFLELHSRITGEEPEPVPTFMEKCSVCSEKVDGVQRCSHCDKKVCPECKEAHVDLLRREINRVNGQIKRCLSKIKEFKDSIQKSEDKLKVNHVSVQHEIEESCRRLIEDLQSKQKNLLNCVNSYAEQEHKTLEKLQDTLSNEIDTLESNVKLCDDHINSQFAWTDNELVEVKEIYVKALEFVRLFDPDLGDFTRKMRFQIIPEFDTMRKRICELGELKFSDTSASLLVASLQFSGATGSSAIEFGMTSGMAANSGLSAYGLAHSNSNTNMNALATSASTMLQLPSMQNALMRSQSDHRLAQQFQQRLKQQEAAGANGGAGSGYGDTTSRAGYTSRYGASNTSGGADTFEQSMRSRYGPGSRTGACSGGVGGRGGAGDQSDRDLERLQLTRDWPRPSDTSSELGGDLPFSSSIQFKSAFMRRKEKERQAASSVYGGDDDDDNDSSITSASYTGRNVRFNHRDYGDAGNDQQVSQQAAKCKLFDCEEVERGPLSGIIRLSDCPYLLERLHQLDAKSKVEKKNQQEEEVRNEHLRSTAQSNVTHNNNNSDTRPINYSRQLSEDEIEKQKKANKLAEQQQQTAPGSPISTTTTSRYTTATSDTNTSNASATSASALPELSGEARPTPRLRSRVGQNSPVTVPGDNYQSGSTATQTNDNSGDQSDNSSGATTVTTTAKRPSRFLPNQQSTSINTSTTRRETQLPTSGNTTPTLQTTARSKSTATAQRQSDSNEPPNDGATDNGSTASPSATRTRKGLRSMGRSNSKQSSIDQPSEQSTASQISAAATRQRRRLRLQESSRASSSMDHSSMDGGDTLTPSAASIVDSVTDSASRYANSRGQQQPARLLDNDDNNLIDKKNPKNYLAGSGSSRYSATKQRASDDRTTSSDQTTTTTDDDDDDEDDDDDDDDDDNKSSDDDTDAISTSTRRTITPVGASTIKSTARSNKIGISEDDDSDDDDGASQTSAYARGATDNGSRKSRELLPSAVSLLLDRSAQIRKDSLEARNRADSPPQRAGNSSGGRSGMPSTNAVTASSSSTSGTSSPLLSSTRRLSKGTDSSGGSSSLSQYRSALSSSSGAPSSSVAPMTARQRLAYQRSQSIQQDQDDSNATTASNNSNNSIYSTASSGGHRSSIDDGISGTLNKTLATSSMPYQSRFLSRSRTSAALSTSNTPGTDRTSTRSQLDNNSSMDNGELSDSTQTRSSYLTSRDRGTSQTTSQPYRSVAPTVGARSLIGSSISTNPPSSTATTVINLIDDISPFEASFNYRPGPASSSSLSTQSTSKPHSQLQKYLYWPIRAMTSGGGSSSSSSGSKNSDMSKSDHQHLSNKDSATSSKSPSPTRHLTSGAGNMYNFSPKSFTSKLRQK